MTPFVFVWVKRFTRFDKHALFCNIRRVCGLGHAPAVFPFGRTVGIVVFDSGARFYGVLGQTAFSNQCMTLVRSQVFARLSEKRRHVYFSTSSMGRLCAFL